jgi:hypothetical protein
LEDVYKKYHSDEFEILGLDSYGGSRADIEKFKESTGASFPILLNAADYIAKLNTIHNRGSYFIVGPDGTVEASCDDGYKSFDCFAPSHLDSVVQSVLPEEEGSE